MDRTMTHTFGLCESLFLVEISGIEPLTSWMPFKRSPSWAIPPCFQKPLILLDFWAIQFFDFALRCGGAHPVACAPSWAIPPYMGEAQDFDFQFWWGVLVHACTRLPAELYPYVQFLLFCWPNELYFSRVLPICQLLFCFFANRARRARVLCNLGVERYSGLL